MGPNSDTGKKLTGRHVLLMLVAFFGVIIAVNAYFMFSAVTSFRGEDVKGSYRQGLEYNQTIDARGTQADLGWTARVNMVDTDGAPQTLIVKLEDANGRGLDDLDISATLNHRIDTDQDQILTFTHTGRGRYVVDIAAPAGQYTVKAVATRGDDQFKFEHEITAR